MHAAGCPGFTAAGIAADIKYTGRRDLGLIHAAAPAAVAAMFTRNQVQAAPVLLDRQRVAGGCARAVLVNSGIANCCTGEAGMTAARATAAAAADVLGVPEDQVLVASTGVIGMPLPVERMVAKLPELKAALRPDGFDDFSRAIMTTDTVPKLVSRTGTVNGHAFTITGMAKGSGMIRPDMATMLCFVCTDVRADAAQLRAALVPAVDTTLNRLTIDGDTSTNDTTLLLASGVSAVGLEDDDARAVFEAQLADVLNELAHMLVRDGEGVTKVVDVVVRGAADTAGARAVADTVAHSSLVKTALFGADANWGRILAAAGRAGVPFDPNRVDLYFDEVQMVAGGVGLGPPAEAAATRVLRQDELTIVLDLHQGGAWASMLTCDFSVDYVKINADYRT